MYISCLGGGKRPASDIRTFEYKETSGGGAKDRRTAEVRLTTGVTERDFQLILRHFGLEPAHLKRELQREVEAHKTGNAGRPVFSPLLIEWISSAWLIAAASAAGATWTCWRM